MLKIEVGQVVNRGADSKTCLSTFAVVRIRRTTQNTLLLTVMDMFYVMLMFRDLRCSASRESETESATSATRMPVLLCTSID